MPRTRLIIEVPEALDERQQNELRTMLGDALHEFATGPRGDARGYVEAKAAKLRNGFDGMSAGRAFEDKVAQVKRRVSLAKLLHGPALNYVAEPVLYPMGVYTFYRTCSVHELPAATALLKLLPASQYGERVRWLVHDDEGGLTLHGPGGVRYRWNERAWERDGERPRVSDSQGVVHWAHLPRGSDPASYAAFSLSCGPQVTPTTWKYTAPGVSVTCPKCLHPKDPAPQITDRDFVTCVSGSLWADAVERDK